MIVEEQPPVGLGALGYGDDVAGAAELEQHVAGVGEPRGERRGDVIRRAAEHRRAGRQPGRGGGLRRDGADTLMGGDERRKGGGGQAGQRRQLRVERVRGEADEARFERPVALDGQPPREARVDVIVGAEHMPRARENLRLVARDPAQLRRDELLRDALARLVEKRRLVDLGG